MTVLSSLTPRVTGGMVRPLSSGDGRFMNLKSARLWVGILLAYQGTSS